MSTFDASTIVSGNTADLGELIRILEDELPTKQSYSESEGGGSLGTITGSTFTSIRSITITVEADDVVEIHADVSFSHDTANDTVAFALFDDTTELFRQTTKIKDAETPSNTTVTHNTALHYIVENASGSKTYHLKGAVTGGSGTCTYGGRNLSVKISKKRA